MEWTFLITSATLDVSTVKLPPTQAKYLQGRVADRLFLLEEGTGHLERRFAAFLALRAQEQSWPMPTASNCFHNSGRR